MASSEQFDDGDVAYALGQKHKKSKRPLLHAAFVNEAKQEDVGDNVEDSDFDDDADGD